ncbi:unnamed protein product [Ostreobium quekettii]|uniref:Uncharacterized protein n=1 Tax=Ostreobium quekettii TaxID=121088 RepID=A0A8S1IL08_9CHLO|nr:unnamed protein product [Ostreobium quekettii]
MMEIDMRPAGDACALGCLSVCVQGYRLRVAEGGRYKASVQDGSNSAKVGAPGRYAIGPPRGTTVAATANLCGARLLRVHVYAHCMGLSSTAFCAPQLSRSTQQQDLGQTCTMRSLSRGVAS